MAANEIWQLATDIPEEWYEWDKDGLNRLVETLYTRRSTFTNSSAPFAIPVGTPFRTGRKSLDPNLGHLHSFSSFPQ
jgi:hypothetical protein